MGHRSVSWKAVLVSACLFHAAPAIWAQTGCEIPFRCEGHLVVVEATIGATNRLKFIIDTGTTSSVIDRKVVKALGLKRISLESQIAALGQLASADQFHIPMLRIGSVGAPLHCPQADLAFLGVDGIIGLDLLREQKRWRNCETNEAINGYFLTIDFKSRRLQFGVRQQLEHTIPLETSDPEIIVVAMIQGHPLRLAVDTGSHTLILYRESQMRWLVPKSMFPGASFNQLGRTGGGKQVILPDMMLGNERWTNPSGILLDLRNQSIDGLLSVKQLGMKIVHFDFERRLMSWNR